MSKALIILPPYYPGALFSGKKKYAMQKKNSNWNGYYSSSSFRKNVLK